jgi:hypothetical protein
VRKTLRASRSQIAFGVACAIALATTGPLSAQTTHCKQASDLARPTAGISVEQICHNDVPLESYDVDITDASGKNHPQESLVVPAPLAPKTSLLVPPSTYLDLLSPRWQVRARYGTRITVPSFSEKAIDVDGQGGVTCRVLSGLFRMFRMNVAARFTAAVPGTTFDVDLGDPLSVIFSVSEGRVAVTRLVSIHLDTEARDIDLIRVTEYIDATGQNSLKYARAAELWQHFANSAEARTRFNHDLQDAQASGDQILEEDARWNLAQLGTALGPKRGSNATTAALAAAAALGAVLATSKSGSSGPAATQSSTPAPVPGSVTLQGAQRDTVQSTPTPKPTPLPLPALPDPVPVRTKAS